jgi:hypothetical protein
MWSGELQTVLAAEVILAALSSGRFQIGKEYFA